jgi:hypothetical protein
MEEQKIITSKSVNWNKALQQVPMDDIETWIFLSLKSRSWVTCAVGSQCDRLERDEDGSPEDRTLYGLGVRFHHTIETIKETVCRRKTPLSEKVKNERFNRYTSQAKVLLNQIEERSTYLISLL